MDHASRQSQRAFDYQAPFAGALRLSLGIAVVGALMASLTMAHGSAARAVTPTDTVAQVIVLPPVEIVAKRKADDSLAAHEAESNRATAAAAMAPFDRPSTVKQ